MASGEVWATVITDASFDYTTKRGGWAAWIKIDGRSQPIKMYGAFKSNIQSSSDAERAAAVNGVWIAARHGAECIFLQSDCMDVINLANRKAKKQRSKKTWEKMLSDAGLLETKIRAKHVRGHTNKQDPRSYCNRWCDSMANKARKAAT